MALPNPDLSSMGLPNPDLSITSLCSNCLKPIFFQEPIESIVTDNCPKFPCIILNIKPVASICVCSKDCFKTFVMNTFYNKSPEMCNELDRFKNWDHEKTPIYCTKDLSVLVHERDLEERKYNASLLYRSFLLFCEKDLGAKPHLIQLLDDYVDNSNYESRNCALNLVRNEIKK